MHPEPHRRSYHRLWIAILFVAIIAPLASSHQAMAGIIVFISAEDVDLNPVADGCYQIAFANRSTTDVCDNDAVDKDPADGAIAVTTGVSGNSDPWKEILGVSEISAPPGYVLLDDLQPAIWRGANFFFAYKAASGGVSNSRTTTCTVIELYPGYPGYRGFNTGIMGIGDTACLEDLEAQGFDKDAEDQANLTAAKRLDIDGGMEDFSWENWLAINLDRGLLEPCVLCIFNGEVQRTGPLPTDWDSDDPRLYFSGNLWGTDVRDRIVTAGVQQGRRQVQTYFVRRDFTNMDLWILSTLCVQSPTSHPNAENMARNAEAIVDWEFLFDAAGNRQDPFDEQSCLNTLTCRGSWFQLTASMSAEYELQAVQSALTAILPSVSSAAAEGVNKRVTRTYNDWRASNANSRLIDALSNGALLGASCTN